MADLDDLKLPDLHEMSPDEAIEYLRQIRLSRRTPKASNKKSPSTKKKIAQSKAAKKITKTDAQALLKLLR